MFKKKFKNFMCNLGKLFTFSFGFLGLFGLIVLLGGWSNDGNNNLVSDNLYSGQQYYKYDSIVENPIVIGDTDFYINPILLDSEVFETYIYLGIKLLNYTDNDYFGGFGVLFNDYHDTIEDYLDYIAVNIDSPDLFYHNTYNDFYIFRLDISEYLGSSINYIEFDIYGDYAEFNEFTLSSKPLYYYEPYNELYYNEDNIGTISFNIDDYSISVGNTPTQISYNYTKTEDIPNNFNSIGYLDISFIYQTYISSGSNNTIYISTPVNNLLSFDMQFNYNTMPNTTIKTFLSLPNGMVNNFIFSSDDFNYKENWSLSNFVAVSQIATNFDLNDISYVDIMITYNNVGNTLSEIKLGSNNGYNTGFTNGYNKGLEAIDFWKLHYNNLKADYNALSSTVDSLKNQINQLNEQLENTVGWKPFIFTMADTPFRVVSNVLGFEVFGVNLYKVLVGLITTLAILWLIRKLRK